MDKVQEERLAETLAYDRKATFTWPMRLGRTLKEIENGDKDILSLTNSLACGIVTLPGHLSGERLYVNYLTSDLDGEGTEFYSAVSMHKIVNRKACKILRRRKEMVRAALKELDSEYWLTIEYFGGRREISKYVYNLGEYILGMPA